MIRGARTAGSTRPTEPQVCCRNIAATAISMRFNGRHPLVGTVPTQSRPGVNVGRCYGAEVPDRFFMYRFPVGADRWIENRALSNSSGAREGGQDFDWGHVHG